MASELSQKITKQIEYYFGNVNLSKDKFLRDLTGKEDGWIPIKTLLTFNRLKSLTENESDIVEAFETANSETVELNEAKDKLRRSVPLPEYDEKLKQDLKLKTVHLKGFPKETTTLDEMIEFCTQYGEVESVQMRRFPDKTFKGCCFAIFKDVESANKAISSNDKFKGEHEIPLRENKETYFARKKSNRNVKKDNKLIDLNKDETKDDEKEQTEEKNEQKEEELKYESGCVLKIVDLPKDVNYRDIKSVLLEHGKVQYVDLFPETKSGIIRFASKEITDNVCKILAADEQNGNTNGTTQNGNANGKETIEETKSEELKNNEKDETKEDESKTDENKEDESKTDESKEDENKTDESKEDENKEDENKEENMDTDQTKNGTESVQYKGLKINDNLVLKYFILDGDEEKEYWQKIKKLSLQHSNNNNHKKHHKKNHHKNSRFSNKNFKNKRPPTDNGNSSKKVKVDAE